jgi:hypothetical protein
LRSRHSAVARRSVQKFQVASSKLRALASNLKL